jgi:hypothetical protein
MGNVKPLIVEQDSTQLQSKTQETMNGLKGKQLKLKSGLLTLKTPVVQFTETNLGQKVTNITFNTDQPSAIFYIYIRPIKNKLYISMNPEDQLLEINYASVNSIIKMSISTYVENAPSVETVKSIVSAIKSLESVYIQSGVATLQK